MFTLICFSDNVQLSSTRASKEIPTEKYILIAT
jgi:hypothetical protein